MSKGLTEQVIVLYTVCTNTVSRADACGDSPHPPAGERLQAGPRPWGPGAAGASRTTWATTGGAPGPRAAGAAGATGGPGQHAEVRRPPPTQQRWGRAIRRRGTPRGAASPGWQRGWCPLGPPQEQPPLTRQRRPRAHRDRGRHPRREGTAPARGPQAEPQPTSKRSPEVVGQMRAVRASWRVTGGKSRLHGRADPAV